jgi:hypothetical protein
MHATAVLRIFGWGGRWTGSQMIIWGGITVTQKGNLYCARTGVSP